MPHDVLFDVMPGLAQLLPIRQFRYDAVTLAANNVGRVPDIAAVLCIGDKLLRGDRKIGRVGRLSNVDAQASAPNSEDARISAKCRQRTPVRWRLSAPLMCIRQELSSAVQISACEF